MLVFHRYITTTYLVFCFTLTILVSLCLIFTIIYYFTIYNLNLCLLLQVNLADSGYPCMRNLMPVFTKYVGVDKHEQRRRQQFNKLAASCSILVEQCPGKLKLHWRFLHDELRCKIPTMAKITISCADLHNFIFVTGGGIYRRPSQRLIVGSWSVRGVSGISGGGSGAGLISISCSCLLRGQCGLKCFGGVLLATPYESLLIENCCKGQTLL